MEKNGRIPYMNRLWFIYNTKDYDFDFCSFCGRVISKRKSEKEYKCGNSRCWSH